MAVQKLDRVTLQLIGSAVARALQPFAEKNNLTIEMGGGQLTGQGLTAVLKLDLAIKAVAGGKSAAQVEFERRAHWLGLEPADFGREFIHNGKRFRICGVFNGHKYNLLAEAPNGKVYKWVAQNIKYSLLPVRKAA